MKLLQKFDTTFFEAQCIIYKYKYIDNNLPASNCGKTPRFPVSWVCSTNTHKSKWKSSKSQTNVI